MILFQHVVAIIPRITKNQSGQTEEISNKISSPQVIHRLMHIAIVGVAKTYITSWITATTPLK